ncbi:MAG: NAD(P)(+) transhydrogenase (Re/Si-specific) subunit beta [Gemmatimonadales bacterium]|nr:MAG: NAD(P)(+) transhydrogenase (Re/Si-specific) subunit beta [Gemmatimonadales bacterium]
MTFYADLAYLLSAFLFVVGLKQLSSPATARKGNQMAALAMLIAIVVTLVEANVLSWSWIIIGIITGSLVGAAAARMVKMTAMPEMVGIFNGFGGGASAMVAGAEFFRLQQAGSLPLGEGSTIMLGMLIGAVTFSGSIVAFGKLAGWITGNPVTNKFLQGLNAVLFIGIIAASVYMVTQDPSMTIFLVLIGASLLLGALLVNAIGGADMPVAISLLNSYSGLAASMAGFILGNMILIIAGALVGASGLILTNLMCKAMNRSLANVVFGGFGTEGATAASIGAGDKTARSVDAEGAAMILAYCQSVVVVPGYGLAVAQAQHDLKKLCDLLEERGVDVKFAIHPVAGRMPGHMNVLLAEADVPYNQLYDLEEINDQFKDTDVALVVGANDVVNPDARNPESVIAGMPILDVDLARNVIVMKRSLSPGFAGIDNPLFYMSKTMMFFGSAKGSMQDLVREVRDA